MEAGSSTGGKALVCWLTAPEIVALGGAEKLAKYIDWAEDVCFVPTPGNVDVFIGGPPCQGVGGPGLNGLYVAGLQKCGVCGVMCVGG
jgi:hypothetical protein